MKGAIIHLIVGVLMLGLVVRTHAQTSERYQKLTLMVAVEAALQSHPSIGAARAGEEESTAGVGQSSAELYPQFSGNASLAQYDKPMLVAPLFEFDFTQPPHFDKTLLRGQLNLGYTLFDGGGRKARVRGAQARAAGATAGRLEAEMMLTARVARAYLKVLSDMGVRDAQDRRREALGAERDRVDQFLAEGRAAPVELLRVEASLAGAEAEQIANSVRLDLAERELARLMRVPADQTRGARLSPVRLVEGKLSEDWEPLVGRARESSPELLRSQKEVEAADAERQEASAAWAPRVGLLGEYQAYGSNSGDWTGLWQAGVRLSYPIYTGGARSSAVEGAEARARKAREELRMKELEVEEDVDQALTLALEARAFVAAVNRAVQHQSEVVRIERLSLDAGAGTQTDYLRAEADLLSARSSLVKAQHAEIAAWVEVARVTGELTPAWLETHLEGVP